MEDNEKIALKILYVEDDASTREEIADLLKWHEIDVIAAKNGKEGLELFRAHAPELIITDIRMPVMDGLQMVREIRAIDRDVKIIVTTAHSDTSYLIEAIELDVDRYVMKPVSTEKLMHSIRKCAESIAYMMAARQHKAEQEQLIKELQEALAKVKLLSGMLPICSACKKIRNDSGYWQQMELYIADHSEAEFSHGICPDCMEKLYPEYVKNDGDVPWKKKN